MYKRQRFLAPEAFIKYHRVFGTAFFQDIFPERFGGSLVVNTLLFENRESICIQHFRPLIAVVAGSITSSEDMAETGRETATVYGREGFGRGHCLIFECLDRTADRRSDRMPGHVDQAEAQLTVTLITTLEIGRFMDFGDIFLGNFLSGVVMYGPGKMCIRDSVNAVEILLYFQKLSQGAGFVAFL